MVRNHDAETDTQSAAGGHQSDSGADGGGVTGKLLESTRYSLVGRERAAVMIVTVLAMVQLAIAPVAAQQDPATSIGGAFGVLLYFLYLIVVPAGALFFLVGLAISYFPFLPSSAKKAGRKATSAGGLVILIVAVGPYVINYMMAAVLGTDAALPTFTEVGADAVGGVFDAMTGAVDGGGGGGGGG